MKDYQKIVILLVWFLIFIGCMTTEPVVNVVNYDLVSVPEEGGINFTQMTNDNESIVRPNIRLDAYGRLQWYASPFIAVSNNHEYLAYLRKENDFFNIILRRTAGGQSTTQRTFNRAVLSMNFSRDNRWIAFSEIRFDGSLDINMINTDEGAAVREIIRDDTQTGNPVFSIDDQSIFFTRSQGNRYYIWNFNLNTSIRTQYAEGFTPVVTPDGEHLIITRNNRDTIWNRGEIWMINMRTGAETLILRNSSIGFSSPSISPDGNTLIVVGSTPATSTRPQNLDIYSVRIDGTQVYQLTFHGGHDVSPVWVPDGDYIYFLSQRGNSSGLYNVWRMNIPNYQGNQATSFISKKS